jgi:hypothetical protein
MTATETRTAHPAEFVFTLTCALTAETQCVAVCQSCSKQMPTVDGDRVRTRLANDETCEFCPA